ncbi:unnamed protein product [Cylindrotheca closterium]|uniref:YbaK/aminoacyl-tRNA synthetase-associated domain-containing protein n=1 Tax=Cylindrotheca closterium TaxID=2856 RepID=A0AAD2PVF6_9STRA|nr:unnamed protein product [Cylindrotheca closterium]
MTSHQEMIIKLFEENRITDYHSLHHAPTKTSEESAKVRGVDLSSGGKALVLKYLNDSDEESNTFGVFVMSASRKLHTKAIKKEFKTKNVRFANAEELAGLTNGLVPGSVPPFGKSILNMELFVDTSIQDNDIIAFNCGSLTDSIIMSTSDYIAVAQPTKIFSFSKE